MLHNPSISVGELVFEEVAMNHNKQLNVEFAISDYQVLAKAMSKLDFPLVPPTRFTPEYTLIGGRYCSIQGTLAAQLKVKIPNSHRVATLYITPLSERLERIGQQNISRNGVNMSLWHRNGLFYALATSQ